MIFCLKSNFRYYGESKNVSGRLASHKSLLKRNIHPNISMQNDYNQYGEDFFDFVVLFIGDRWQNRRLRRKKETLLIQKNSDTCYNVLESQARPKEQNPFWNKRHTCETRKRISQALKGRPNNLLGRPVSIQGIEYPSIAEASRQTKMARKTIRKKINDPKEKDFFETVKKQRSNDHPKRSKIQANLKK